MRRILPWLLIALALGLVLVLSRTGTRASAPAAEPRPLVPTVELHEPPHAVEVVAPEAGTERVAVPPSAARAARHAAPAGEASALSVSGRVVDDLGEPVTRFAIHAEPTGVSARGGAKRRALEREVEGPDGFFSLAVSGAGEWSFTATTRDGARSAPAVLDVPGKNEGFVLVLPRSGAIAGFVVDAAGAPVGDVELYLLYPGDDDPMRRDPAPATGGSEGSHPLIRFGPTEPEPRARTEPSGRFRIEGVLPGTLRILARHADFADSSRADLSVAPGALVEGVEIRLTHGGRIEGFVQPSLGDVGERELDLFSFRGMSGWREDGRSDAAGHFAIENVVPQEYVIELRPAGYGKPGFQDQEGIRKNIAVKEGQTTQVVFGEARREIAISGQITLAGAPAPGLKVRANSRDNEDHGEEVETDAHGAFALTLHGAGDYIFAVSANYGSDVWFERTVPDQDAVAFSFEVPGGALRGRVVDAQGRPLGHVGVTAERSGWTDRQSFYRDHYNRTYTEADGTFVFRLLAAGTYTLRAPDGFQSDSPPPRVPHGRLVLPALELGASDVSGLELRLPPESRVSGVVIDANGHPITDGWVRLLDQRGLSLSGTWETQTDATGHFQIDSVGPGTYRVRVRVGEREVTGEPFSVEGKTVGTRIELR